jgi:uncharacterized protein YggE
MSRKTAIIAIGAVVLAATLVGGGVVATGFAASEDPDQATNEEPNSRISVSASGQVTTAPDKAVVTVEIEASAPNASTARTRVAENVSSVREALVASGLEESQITTADFDIYRHVERPRRGEDDEEQVVTRARHELRIELDSVDAAGEVIDTAVENGATNVHDVSFTISRDTREELKQEALEDAMASARAKADTLAGQANLTIANVDVVTTGLAHDSGGRTAYEATPAPADGARTNVEAGPVTVGATVSVSYNATASG